MPIGAIYNNNSCLFTVWAPLLKELTLHTIHPEDKKYPMTKDPHGYWSVEVRPCSIQTKYAYCSSEFNDIPDPASFYQPQGVHEPSLVIDHSSYRWHDEKWQGLDLKDMIIYEVHIGTFTKEGTFAAAISRLDEIRDMGINAIEVMPVAQFPGARNWGYDGVHPFAVQNSYGGVEGFKAFVDACHQKGLAVILDVVYNHLGPEGNYLQLFGPYFIKKYSTPWGMALNFDDSFSDEVRQFFIDNVMYWLQHFHVDGFRFDAIHAIMDNSAKPFLAQMNEAIKDYNARHHKKICSIAESDLNDVRVINPLAQGGLGFDAQWSDDFHHALHAYLTKETRGYYQDFGRPPTIAKALLETFVYDWEYSPSRNRHHGSSVKDDDGSRFVVSLQNHDQIGNRLLGERLSKLISFDLLKVCAGILFFSPYVPLLFMGEEYAEDVPFLYFVHHGDPELIKGVRKGRKDEFLAFNWKEEPPDPQSEETFLKSKLCWEKRFSGRHEQMKDFYKTLIDLRQRLAVLNNFNKKQSEVLFEHQGSGMIYKRWEKEESVLCFVNFSQESLTFKTPGDSGPWQKIVDSSHPRWGGAGSTLGETLAANQTVDVPAETFCSYHERRFTNRRTL